MTIRTVLVPITGHPADAHTLALAGIVRDAFGARVSVLHPIADPAELALYVSDWSSSVMTGEIVGAAERASDAERHDARRMFQGWADATGETGGAKAGWIEQVGSPAALLGGQALFADLVIMRGLGPTGPVDGDAMLEAVLFEAGRPALLAPAAGNFDLSAPALIAWAGGREEIHAVTAALPFLHKAASVAIVTVGDAHTDADPLIAYLAAHDLTAQARRLDAAGQPAGEILLAEARALGAGLLVMGAYHHSRAHELVFGGATRRLVAHVEIPVLLAH
jgi:nucleotide-binding universal stress UspA family protein